MHSYNASHTPTHLHKHLNYKSILLYFSFLFTPFFPFPTPILPVFYSLPPPILPLPSPPFFTISFNLFLPTQTRHCKKHSFSIRQTFHRVCSLIIQAESEIMFPKVHLPLSIASTSAPRDTSVTRLGIFRTSCLEEPVLYDVTRLLRGS